MDTKDYKDLLDHGKSVLTEEIARNARLDEKASRMLTGLTVLIGIFAFYAQWILQRISQPGNVLEYLIVVFAAFALLFLIIAWFSAFKVFKISVHSKLPFNNQTFEIYRKFDSRHFFFSVAKTTQNAIEANRSIGDQKVQALTDAYRMIIITSIFLGLLLLTVVVHTWTTDDPAKSKKTDFNSLQKPGA